MESNSPPPDAGKRQEVPGPAQPPAKKPSAWAQVARYSAIGMTIPSHLFAGWLIGTILDRVFSTDYLHVVFVLVGVVSGFIEMIKLASRAPD